MNDPKNTTTKACGLAVRNLELERGERLLFRGLSFEAPAGTLVRLAGANGTGKTSLLRLLTGLMSADAGEILYKGENISKLKEDFHKDLVYIGHMNGVKDDLSAMENVRIAARMGNIVLDDETIIQALSRVGLADFVEHLTGELSQGQRRRVALARLFVSMSKPVWILDEPFVALDVASVANLAQTIAEHVKAGGIVIYTTHQDVDTGLTPQCCMTVDVSDFAPQKQFVAMQDAEEADHA